jgi:signal transduction histidine kinase
MKDEDKTREQLIDEINGLRKQITGLQRTAQDIEGQLRQTSMELAIGLSEVFEALRKISSGDPEVRIPEESEVELISHLKHMVNMTAANIGEIVDQSHEFAMLLAEHFDVFHRVIRGDLSARIDGESKVELLEALKRVSNKMIECMDREISERRKTEEALRESERKLRQSHERLEAEVRERTIELVKANEELARSNADLKDFAHVVSHDLKSPLHTIEGFAKLLDRRYKGRIDAKADEFIRYIVEGAERMEDLIKDLLEYSQLGVKAEKAVPTDCSLIVQEVIGNLKASLEENHAVLTHDAMPTITADPSQMISLFQNLIDNAIKFRGEERPRIHISAERKEEGWVFSVRDNGIGIDSEDSEKIFGMFQRLHSSAAYPGTGIGLATCRKIVESHGGKIWVDSEPGKGSTFYFTIPYKEATLYPYQRQHQRRRKEIPFDFYYDERHFKAYTIDFSEGGLARQPVG